MAKALLGGVGRIDPHTTAHIRRLQQRVIDLETEILRLQAENDALHEVAHRTTGKDDLLVLAGVATKEPVLA